MIPRTLTLSNFLSYGEQPQTVDFTQYSLMCLSGKNGHGKSALLDAITWALWGQARKVSGNSKADAGLLRLGSTRMMVSFSFTFNGREYRVRREYAKTHGKPFASLDVEVQQEDGSYVSLTDKTIRATQAKIEDLLGLDFETFANSAFLRQGQSNEFSKKSAKDRKVILGTILGLSRFDQLQARASEKGRSFASEKKVLQALREEADKEVEQRAHLEQDLQNHNDELAKLDKLCKGNKMHGLLLEKLRADLTVARKEEERLRGLKEQSDAYYEKTKHALRDVLLEWKRVHKQSLENPDISQLEKAKTEVAKREYAYRGLQQKSLQVQQDILKEQHAIEKRKTEVTGQFQKRVYEQKMSYEKLTFSFEQEASRVKEKQLDADQISKQLDEQEKQKQNWAKEREVQGALARKIQTERVQFEKRKQHYQRYCSLGTALSQQLTELELRSEMLNDEHGAACPTCEQMLSAKRKSFLCKQFKNQSRLLAHRRNRFQALTRSLKAALTTQHGQLAELEKQQQIVLQGAVKAEQFAKHAAELRGTLGQIESELTQRKKDTEVLKKKLAAEKSKLAVEQQFEVDKDETLVALQARVAILQSTQKAIGYDRASHQNVLKELQARDEQLAKLNKFREALDEQPTRKRLVRDTIGLIRAERKNSLALDKELKAYADLSGRDKQLQEKLVTFERELKTLRLRHDELLKLKGRVENQLAHITKVEGQQKERTKQLKVCDTQIACYQVLAQAFGKNGVQALLIEQAIPEIENEANQILGRLTDNQSQVFIESLRDLKKGGVRETLDIQISDSAGVRPYELFSGGEAFRIDFALRIAISKLLARRAGTALQTLIIDEGFGSQDEEGLSRLMDAIHAIQNDFAKIIVVSHMSEFKENFPVHLVVEKRSDGSHVSLHERG